MNGNLVSLMKTNLVLPSMLRDETKPGWGIGRSFLCLALIFALAFVVRLVMISQLSVPPVYDLLWNDAVAWNLVQGHGFTASQAEPYVPGIFRTPGYPGFLAVVYYLFGHSYQAAFVSQAFLDALSAVLVTLIGLRLLSPSIALIGGCLYAVYPYSSYFCGVLSQDILLTFTVLAALYLTTRVDLRRPARLQWLLVGLTIGFAALVKSFLILYVVVPALLVLLAVRGLRLKIGAFAMLGLGVAVVISPWVVRNYVQFQSFPPLAVGGMGSDLTLIVRELDGGEEAVVNQIVPPRYDQEGESEYSANFIDGAPLIEEEKEAAENAFRDIMQRKKQYLLLILRHIPRLWLTQHTLGHGNVVAMVAAIVSWVYLIPGVLGMYALRNHWQRLAPLFGSIMLVTLIYAPYLAEARYTLPVRPMLMLFVATTVYVVAERVQTVLRRTPTVGRAQAFAVSCAKVAATAQEESE